MTHIRRHRKHSGSYLFKRLVLLLASVFLATCVAYFVLPTKGLNTQAVVKVNGRVFSLAPQTSLTPVIAKIIQKAKPGPLLALTGDVITFAGGMKASLSIVQEQGQVEVFVDHPARPNNPLHELANLTSSLSLVASDGVEIRVQHGQGVLETLARKQEVIPYDTITVGNGPVLTLSTAGAPGLREIYVGARSGKQAAVVVKRQPQNAVLTRSAPKKTMKLVALTFDDGPDRYTKAVLQALAAYKVPATFFVMGGNARAHPEIIKEIRQHGHEIGNHTWSHPILTRLTDQEIRRQLEKTNAVVGKCRYLRPPYGIYDERVVSIAAGLGMKVVLWTVDTLDWKYPSVDSILSYVKRQTRPGAIILLHDGGRDRSQTVAAIPRIVEWLWQNDYSIAPLSEVLATREGS